MEYYLHPIWSKKGPLPEMRFFFCTHVRLWGSAASLAIKILDSRVNKYFNLERKEYVKYLVVMIDNHLSWIHHINYIALKISRNIGILSKLRLFVPPKTLYGIYNSLIFPYLSYGLVAWGQAAKTHLEKLLTLQKRAVRLINFAPFRPHAVPYFLHSNIMPITMLYFKLSSVLMFDACLQ